MRIAKCFVFFVLISANLFSQSKYWIFFDETHKNSSENIAFLQNNSINIIQKSAWLNSFSAYLNQKEVEYLLNFKQIKQIEKIDGYFFQAKKNKTENLDQALKQMQSEVFIEAGLSGQNIKIGVIDAGFYGAKSEGFLKNTFYKNNIVAVKDFLNPNKTNHYDDPETGMDYHGSEVLTYIAGIDSVNHIQRGLAPNAIFYLARTDHGANETRIEEDNWIAAIEWMHSKGVKLVNSSLGYTDGFNDVNENYLPKQMDGKTSRISQFANLAVNEKGMFLVISAGNEGDNNNWKVISTPADAVEVMSVGATNMGGLKMNYSSVGPEVSDFLKPNIACFSAQGTSFSAPIITGMIACMIEADSTLTNKEIFNIIEQSGNLFPYPNNYVGNGTPELENVLKLIHKEKINKQHKKIVVKNDTYKIEFSAKKPLMICIFHKKDPFNVISQKMIKVNTNVFEVKKEKNTKFTTLDLKELGLIEIEWK